MSTMDFSTFDMGFGRFNEISTYVVTRSAIPPAQMKLAMARLIDAWPELTFRVNMLRSHAYESPAESMLDNMLRIRMLDSSVEPYLTQDTTANGFTVRDCRPIASLFEHSTSWIDFFCPRVASVEAVVFKDATAVRFTTQHVACDAFGLYNVARAFCEGLHGHVEKRLSPTATRYTLRDSIDKQMTEEMKAVRKPSPGQMPKIGYISLVGELARNWFSSWSLVTCWQAIHIPKDVLAHWREIALDSGAEVSDNDLVTSWISKKFGEDASNRGIWGQIKLLVAMSIRPFLEPVDAKSDFWNPYVVGAATVETTISDLREQTLVEGAMQIRTAIKARRNPVGQEVFLTSWSHAPFDELPLRRETDGNESPVMVQPEIKFASFVPAPTRAPTNTTILWKSSSGGYWVEGNLSQSLWNTILN
ncbi:hypothetical protein Q7P37_004885 [Cladosporium fusiforme]